MLIFDLDGTLWETVDATYEASCIIADRYKEIKLFSKQTIIKGMGLSNEENAYNYMPYLDRDKALNYLNEIQKESFNIISKKGANVYNNVKETIITLSKNYKLGIITNNKDEYIETFFKISNLKK